ncbi:hypothetical protein [Ferrimicrobium sp.]|uniref:hypothetical protein n=1 Tax=Ferrimicrobium sp. TaxID=2926050 RepID=UPI00261811F1|nr:hypothetical protein [Ferrimicrobium sp.]
MGSLDSERSVTGKRYITGENGMLASNPRMNREHTTKGLIWLWAVIRHLHPNL